MFESFLADYRAGHTPNPDVLCNREIKFKHFANYANTLGADYIATGHYVRVKRENNKSLMLRGIDENKDQSYFLYTLNQSQLNKSMFPVGELEKPQVRKIAEEQGFVTANKKDSTGICFIGERKFKDFLEQFLPAQPGNIEDDLGNVIGKHNGLMYHTLGQRKGIGIGGRASASEEPWYAVEKDMQRNVLIVGQGHDHPKLLSRGLIGSQMHWVDPSSTLESFECTAKSRYRQHDFKCTVTRVDEANWEVTFNQQQRAITPGQSIVFYQNEKCLGGGIIDTIVFPSNQTSELN